MNFQYFCVASCNNNAIFEGFSLICSESLSFLKRTIIKVFATCLFMHQALSAPLSTKSCFFPCCHLRQVFQFKFLVMRGKAFLLINFFHWIFQIFLLYKNCNPSEKVQPPLSKQPPSKNWDPVKPPFLKIWKEAEPLSNGEGGGAHYALKWCILNFGIAWDPKFAPAVIAFLLRF